ncbi:TonB-dependent receptor plug domain-containing protein [Paucibacter sp. JuS9]|uniref:TonB-dependent receptor plug domain-containing protein n=1 Tax=Paucibacter sp. JuS9 TaxID=3228748 RepID=UPI003757DED5
MQFKKTPLASAVTGLALMTAGLAFAQAQTNELERVVVTGSNIKRIDAETATPVQVIDKVAIDRSAAANVGELLRDISANSGGSYSETSINNQSGAAGVSLRGLGQKSTLVLINGRRMANHAIAQNGQDTFVDLNSIPKSAVARIEVLKDGASAIYGSDAIAGVVNIILRKDLKGGEIAVNTGRSSQGGLAEHGLNLAGGFSALGGKLSVTAVADLFKRDMLLLSDRPWLNGLDFRFLPGGTFFPGASGGTWQRSVFVPPATLSLQRQALPNCLGDSTSMNALIGAGVYSGTACTYTVDKYLTAYPESTRKGGLARASLQLDGGMEAFAELALSDNKSSWINQPQTMTNQSVVFNPATGGFSAFSNIIPAIATDADRVALLASNKLGGSGTSARLNYTFFDVGARTFALENKTARALAGLSGSSKGWDWEVAVGSSRSEVEQSTGNQVDALALRTALDKGGYNFLAPSTSDSAKLRVSTMRNAESRLSFADAKVSTTLAQLEGGALGFAAGLEARRESMVDTPDPLAQQGRLIGTGSSRNDGSRSASAAYAELVAPVTKQLEFQLAGRADRYNDFGNAFSPKLGLKYVFSPAVLVRASSARGFRAPTLVENSASASLGFESVQDPVLSNASSIVGVLNTGSKDLKAEKSTSNSFGLVVEPVRGVIASVDYYSIEQRNLVALNGAQFIVRNPTLFPGSVVRQAGTNQILVVYDSYSNLAKVKTQGLDFEIGAKFAPLPIGRFGVRLSATQLLNWEYTAKAGGDAVDYAGRNDGPFGAMPKLKARATLDWAHGDFSSSLSWNHTGAYEQRVTTGAGVDGSVADMTTVDLFLAYTGVKNLKLSLGIKNLGDRNPPWDVSTGLGYSTAQYDLRGRYLRAGLEYKF